MEFRIDLLPGSAPILKSAYHMAPKELEEMKNQLDEMLQKGCVKFFFLVVSFSLQLFFLSISEIL